MKNIVTIGGGTGSYTVLSGLKNIPDVSLTALVSMADDGGSTGVLMDELGVLPPGDVRQCLVALSEHSDLVRGLMKYRFDSGSLKGHNFGNIFLAALEKVSGDFVTGVEVASEILKVKGAVVPVTKNIAELYIMLQNRKLLKGENVINHSDIQSIGMKNIYYKKNVKLNPHAKKALMEADYILLGPGNHYCSVVPNLIVDGFKDAIKKSKAKIIFPVNLTNKQGHSMHWGVREYVEDIEKYIGKKVDIILVNNKAPSKEQVKAYRIQEGDGVLVKDNMNDKRIMRIPLLSHTLITFNKADKIKGMRSFIRHDSQKLAKSIEKIIKI